MSYENVIRKFRRKNEKKKLEPPVTERNSKNFQFFHSGLRCLRVFNSRGRLKRIARKKQFTKPQSNLKGKRKKILSSEWLPLTSMNAAASRLKRS